MTVRKKNLLAVVFLLGGVTFLSPPPPASVFWQIKGGRSGLRDGSSDPLVGGRVTLWVGAKNLCCLRRIVMCRVSHTHQQNVRLVILHMLGAQAVCFIRGDKWINETLLSCSYVRKEIHLLLLIGWFFYIQSKLFFYCHIDRSFAVLSCSVFHWLEHVCQN